MKYIITLTLSLITLSLFSQDKLLFNELYEVQDNQVKVYLDGVYKVIYKDCADYYMICKINKELEYTDSVHIYDLKDRLVAKGFFQSSKLSGDYSSYFQNGQIESTGRYRNGFRTGIWEFYYNNNQIKKVIDFGDGSFYPILNSFFKKKGKQRVIEGNGKFDDLISTSISSRRGIKYKGKVLDGFLDGTWKIEDNGTVVAKEIYEKGKLIEGTSFSVMFGNQKYYDNPATTIFEINYLEHVKIWGPSICPGNIATLGLSTSFFAILEELLKVYVNDSIKIWYFAEFQTADNGYFDRVTIFPKNDILQEHISNGLKNVELETIVKPFKGSEVIIIFFYRDEVYFNKTQRIDNFILNFKY